MPRSRTSRHNKDASKESGRKREQLFAPEQDEWQRLSPNRARSKIETNSGQKKTRFEDKTGQMVKSLSQRSKVRRHRSISNQRAKEEKPNQPMISGRARKTASKLKH